MDMKWNENERILSLKDLCALAHREEHYIEMAETVDEDETKLIASLRKAITEALAALSYREFLL